MSTIKPLTVPSKRLAASINASSSAFQLNNILGWDGNALTSADFGSIAYVIFRNDANTQMEIAEFDPTTIASSSVTLDRRGLKFDGTLTTEVTANKLTWVKNETIVELGTNVPQMLNHMVRTIGDQTIAGIKTFSSLPAITAGNPVDDNDIARKKYVDDTATGTTNINRIVVAATAGETIADGNLVYFDTVTNNEWMLADADTAAKAENVLLGIAQGAGTNGVAITNGVLLLGVDDAQSGMTIGDIMYASDTAGSIASSAGTKEVIVGAAKTATELYFSPRYAQQLTQDQIDALAGSGTPSGANKYVTQDTFDQAIEQDGAEIYAADAEASDTYVATLSPVPSAYTTGMVVNIKVNTANTGACTLNLNTLGAKSIKKQHDVDPATGDIEANQILTLVYDGTNFQMQSQVAQDTTTYPNKLLVDATAVTIVSSNSEETLSTVSVPANTFSTNNAIRFKVYIKEFDMVNGDTCTIKFKYGSTTLITLVLNDSTGARTNFQGHIEGVIMAAGATNSQDATMAIRVRNTTGWVIGEQIWSLQGAGTSAEDSTGALNLLITGQFNDSSASNKIVVDHTVMDIIQS